jgi:hypothetical protein
MGNSDPRHRKRRTEADDWSLGTVEWSLSRVEALADRAKAMASVKS